MLRFAGVTVGDGAPLACARCAPGPSPAYAPAADVAGRIEAVAAAWADDPGPNIVLGGPEPFAHPALPEIVHACARAGCRRIGIVTDGGALSVGGNAAGVLASGVTHLWVRMLAADPDLADELSGHRGLGPAAAQGVARFLEAAASRSTPVVVTADVPLCRHNLEAVSETVARLASWGIDAVRLSHSQPLPASASATIAAACDTGMVNRLWVEVDADLPLPASHALHRARWSVEHE